jgi:1-acyl-sn-glycerol-3-phosphate acyltransferase
MTHQPTATEIAALSGRRAVPDIRFMPIDGVVWWLERGPGRAVPTVWDVLTRPLPFKGLFDRLLLRGAVLIARRRVRAIHGLERVLVPEPFILALNHNTRREALAVPALLIFHRGGRLIHFWSDWMFRLMPGVGLMLGRAGTIAVTTKLARPRPLNQLRRFFMHPLPALDQARALLMTGNAIGAFPEGTVNRDPAWLLPGRLGTARLSLETGMPIVPAGIRFPEVPPGAPVPENAAMEIAIGAPLKPPRRHAGSRPTLTEVRAWHAVMMKEIAHLSGKSWQAPVAESGDAASLEV